MLGSAHRLTSSSDFGIAFKGSRSARPTVVVHVRFTTQDSPGRVGFVVSKAVGNAVMRNTVKRRMREIVRIELLGDGRIAHGSVVVLRALPAAARATFGQLRDHIVEAYGEAERRAMAKASQTGSASSQKEVTA